MTLSLSDVQVNAILNELEVNATRQALERVWKKRSYCPMHIHTAQFAELKYAIERQFPKHCVAFDVVFESSGKAVDWHCDYESLGPFDTSNSYQSMKDKHFLSIHFNLTSDGGCLCTMNEFVLLSYIHYKTICYFGIYSNAHNILNVLCRLIFWLFATKHPNTQDKGNVFNNMELHSVSQGKPRTSYVIRLIRKHRVKISKDSVKKGIQRSNACRVFSCLLDNVPSEPNDAHLIEWEHLFKSERD